MPRSVVSFFCNKGSLCHCNEQELSFFPCSICLISQIRLKECQQASFPRDLSCSSKAGQVKSIVFIFDKSLSLLEIAVKSTISDWPLVEEKDHGGCRSQKPPVSIWMIIVRKCCRGPRCSSFLRNSQGFPLCSSSGQKCHIHGSETD